VGELGTEAVAGGRSSEYDDNVVVTVRGRCGEDQTQRPGGLDEGVERVAVEAKRRCVPALGSATGV
jgi:hypothetical protein